MTTGAGGVVGMPLLRAWLDGLGLRERERADRLAALGVSEAAVLRTDAWVDDHLEAALVDWAIARHGPGIGLRAAARLGRGAWADVEYEMRTAADLRQAIARLVVRQGRWFRPARWRWDGATRLSLRAREGTGRAGTAIAEFVLAGILRVLGQATVPAWRPTWVRLRHATATDPAAAREAFGAKVHYGAERDEVAIPAAALALPMREADPRLHEILVSASMSAGASSSSSTTRAERVRAFIDDRLASGVPPVAAVATALGIATRTLQEQLAAEGVRYRDLVESARRQRAEHYLQDARLALPDIARLLGYSEPSAFHRAFKRWTGRTPRTFREGGSD